MQVLSVVKDDGYGHGALAVAQMALDCGATFLALSTLEEAIRLARRKAIACPLLLLGDRQEAELALVRGARSDLLRQRSTHGRPARRSWPPARASAFPFTSRSTPA